MKMYATFPKNKVLLGSSGGLHIKVLLTKVLTMQRPRPVPPCLKRVKVSELLNFQCITFKSGWVQVINYCCICVQINL